MFSILNVDIIFKNQGAKIKYTHFNWKYLNFFTFCLIQAKGIMIRCPTLFMKLFVTDDS